MELAPHPFAVDQILRDISAILSINLGDKPVELLFDIDPTLPKKLIGDALRLQQILLNLGTNAVKFTAQGEVILSVRVMWCSTDMATLHFSVRDSGIGIAPENQARIFTGFTQAESSTTRRFGGTGLGLAISHRFVALMGGELEVCSELGKGSRFYFTVTMPVVHSEEQKQLMHANSGSSAAWRVLIVDDSAIARELLEQMGHTMGWKMDLVESGEKALDLLRLRLTEGLPYQAIFVDWSMPSMDGWQTSQLMREMQVEHHTSDIHKNAAIIVMGTAHGRERLSQRVADEQTLLDGFLVKPVTASMLLDAVVDARNNFDQPHPSRAQPPSKLLRLNGMRLLLVEDNLNNQQVARELLEDEGAVVHIANHGQEAIAAINASQAAFDVVLMDWQMPVMDGFAATKIIRNELCLGSLPIVAMTANAMTGDREACLTVGMNDHIGKPFDLNDLVRVLRSQAKWGDPLPPAEHQKLVPNPDVLRVAFAAGVDMSAALIRLGGTQDVYRRMLQTFLIDLPEIVQQLSSPPCLQGLEGATVEAKRLLHTSKGLAATLGASMLAAEVAAAEKIMASTSTADQFAKACANACMAIDNAIPGLRGLLEALSSAPMGISGVQLSELDRTAVVSALQTLVDLLKIGDMEAMNAMAILQYQRGDTFGDEFMDLEQAMANLDFDAALPICEVLLKEFNR